MYVNGGARKGSRIQTVEGDGLSPAQPQQVWTQTAQPSARWQKQRQAGEGRAELNSPRQNLGSMWLLLTDLANKNVSCPVKFEFGVNNYFF